MTLNDNPITKPLNYLGERIRTIRIDRALLLRDVSAVLEIDTALLSKAERGLRNLNREHLTKLAQIFNVTEEELVTLWICDKVVSVVGNDPWAEQGIIKALNTIKK